FQAGGGDGRDSGSVFAGGGSWRITNGYESAAAFQAGVDAPSGPPGLTPTRPGINTPESNTARNPAGAANPRFVPTDGSPDRPDTHGDDQTNPDTWLQGADAAIAAANDARASSIATKFVVEAVYLSTDGDPGDVDLPFSVAGDFAWAKAVMTEIG